MSKKTNDTGEWAFNIDLDAIRSEAEKQDAETHAEADRLLAQLDELSAPQPGADTKTLDLPTDGGQAEADPPPDGEAAESAGPEKPEGNAPAKPAAPVPPRRPAPQTRSASSAGGQDIRPPQWVNTPPQPPQPPLTRKEQRAKEKRDRRLAKVEKRRQKNHLRLSAVLAPLLAITNVVTLGFWGIGALENRLTVQEAEEARVTAESQAAALQEELDQNTIPLDQFTEQVAAYNLSAQFIQEFFDDRIVYKDTSVHYAEIDSSLPMNSYDWSALSWENGRPSYTPDGARHALLGVDVSYHQGDIDWEAVAADGVSFAMIRAGYRGYGNGALMTDDYFAANMAGASAAGLETGVYFFSQAVTADEASEEANYLLELLSGYSVTMPVVFDMEVMTEDARANDLTAAERAAIAAAFCDAVAAAGYTPMVYGNTAYYMAKVEFDKICGSYDIWLAQYYDTPFFPYDFSMWQYTNEGSVAGISGPVDMNLYFGE